MRQAAAAREDRIDEGIESWPTPVRHDGTSPSSAELLAAGPAWLVRQATYLVHVAGTLADRSLEVRAVQSPLVTDRVRITVPILLSKQRGRATCAYTQADPWTAHRVAALERWLRHLRAATDHDVLVVAREGSPDVAMLSGISAFMRFPCDTLPD
jgi:hypothetical protein